MRGTSSRQPSCRYPSARERVEYLAHVTEYMAREPARCADPDRRQRRPAADGGGAAGDIIGLTGGQPITDDDEIRWPSGSTSSGSAAGDRFDDLELNIAITALPRDESGQPDLSITRRALPDMSDEELLRTPAVLSGSTREIADTHPRLPRHLRRELPDRPGQARRGVLEGDRRTALTRASTCDRAACPSPARRSCALWLASGRCGPRSAAGRYRSPHRISSLARPTIRSNSFLAFRVALMGAVFPLRSEWKPGCTVSSQRPRPRSSGDRARLS